jgi:hypothetical protein
VPKIDFGDCGSVTSGVACFAFPGTSTDGYSKASGLSLIEKSTGDAGTDAAGVVLLPCCTGERTGVF